MAEEQETLHGLILRRPLMSTTFAVPLSRYTTRLISAADHPRILLGDCVGSHSDADDDAGRPIYGEACVYSRPILVLDVVWNFAFVMVSMVVLLSTFKERPSTPLRLWILGYSLQCILHVGFVYFEYQRKWCADIVGLHAVSSSRSHTSNAKRLDSINKMMSSIWWIIGFYWIVVGGQPLLQNSPRLYWLTMVFLAFDVFIIIFCIGMACVIFFVLCCYRSIVAFVYAMIIREGASEDEIRTLPKYRFRQLNPFGTFDYDKKLEIVGERLEAGNSSHINELVLCSEDSVSTVSQSSSVLSDFIISYFLVSEFVS
ncbi:hypothetical protein FNV43_RR15332 [Rhamnella rubrinervis]|uniref:RING-type E3 ubiquitin transferase n=1 Tax=Rhamnella rubrinervis TaxID=2594499 RepID=A0A8K0GXD3_9ROSA|nr:hypothetical protein FNV43_RR15332 [Rhamnella rubrinervis]